MRLGIIADTHDRAFGIEQAMVIFIEQKVDMIVHCGDWTKPETVSIISKQAAKNGIKLKGVLGNNDRDVSAIMRAAAHNSDTELTEGVLRFEVEGRHIAAYHGHHKPTMFESASR